MKHIRSHFFIFFLLIFFWRCSAIEELSKVQKPSLSLDNARVSGLSLQDIEITFDLEVDNPNPVALTLSSYDYDFMIDENSFVKGNQNLTTKIEASDESIIQVPVNLTFRELYQTFSSLKQKDETGYTFSANVGVNAPVLGLVNIPIEKEGTFPVVKPPSVSLGKVSVTNLSLTKADLEIRLEVDNPNTFGLMMNELNYDLNINGLSSVSGNITETVEVGKNDSGSISVPVSLNLIQLGMGAYQSLKNGEPLNYSLTGNADVGSTLAIFENSSFNFDKSGTVDILR